MCRCLIVLQVPLRPRLAFYWASSCLLLSFLIKSTVHVSNLYDVDENTVRASRHFVRFRWRRNALPCIFVMTDPCPQPPSSLLPSHSLPLLPHPLTASTFSPTPPTPQSNGGGPKPSDNLSATILHLPSSFSSTKASLLLPPSMPMIPTFSSHHDRVLIIS